MDASDVKISFNEAGLCDHCQNFDDNINPSWCVGEKGRLKLEKMAAIIKHERTQIKARPMMPTP